MGFSNSARYNTYQPRKFLILKAILWSRGQRIEQFGYLKKKYFRADNIQKGIYVWFKIIANATETGESQVLKIPGSIGGTSRPKFGILRQTNLLIRQPNNQPKKK